MSLAFILGFSGFVLTTAIVSASADFALVSHFSTPPVVVAPCTSWLEPIQKHENRLSIRYLLRTPRFRWVLLLCAHRPLVTNARRKVESLTHSRSTRLSPLVSSSPASPQPLFLTPSNDDRRRHDERDAAVRRSASCLASIIALRVCFLHLIPLVEPRSP